MPKPPRRLSIAVIIVWVAMLTACQTPGGSAAGLSADPPVFETGMLSSNELNRLGRQHLAAGNSGLAERHFRAAVEKNKIDAASWLGLAAAYDNLKRFDLADRAYDQAIRLQGMNFVIVNNLGYSYLLRGDRNRALLQFEKALALDPRNAVVMNNLRMLRIGELPNRAESL